MPHKRLREQTFPFPDLKTHPSLSIHLTLDDNLFFDDLLGREKPLQIVVRNTLQVLTKSTHDFCNFIWINTWIHCNNRFEQNIFRIEVTLLEDLRRGNSRVMNGRGRRPERES